MTSLNGTTGIWFDPQLLIEGTSSVSPIVSDWFFDRVHVATVGRATGVWFDPQLVIDKTTNLMAPMTDWFYNPIQSVSKQASVPGETLVTVNAPYNPIWTNQWSQSFSRDFTGFVSGAVGAQAGAEIIVSRVMVANVSAESLTSIRGPASASLPFAVLRGMRQGGQAIPVEVIGGVGGHAALPGEITPKTHLAHLNEIVHLLIAYIGSTTSPQELKSGVKVIERMSDILIHKNVVHGSVAATDAYDKAILLLTAVYLRVGAFLSNFP